MYDSPCSRVGHIYRGPSRGKSARPGKDFVSINFKRVAKVWMDEYAEYLYEHLPNVKEADPGDLSKMLAIRKKLHCKPFKWFLEEVAPDLLEKYPPVEPLPFAKGAIQSIAFPNLCIDTMQHAKSQPVSVYSCHENKLKPFYSQMWALTDQRDLRNGEDNCIDVVGLGKPLLFACHQMQGNQLFRYDLVSGSTLFLL